jgi:ribonucleoside-diphosphate reductase alpha chain
MVVKLTHNALKVLEERYFLRNDRGNIIETPEQLFRRVASAVASADRFYGKDGTEIKKTEEEIFQLMNNLEFLPNTPTLMNAGTELGQLSACFVIPVEDNIPSIFEAVRIMAIIHKTAGGTGFSFSKIRPRGDLVKSTHGIASGPLSYMKIFDVATETIKQGGKRRGANMGVLRVDHPDILEFIQAKSNEGFLTNFNISVAVTDKFMQAVEKNQNYELINPRTKSSVKKLNARKVWKMMIEYAWKTGDPGVIFIDEINRTNPTSHIGLIESTNPCGEQPLHPYESCNLGSINLSKMVENGEMNWRKFEDTIKKCVHFLDNVIDANKYPLKEIEKMTNANRRIGFGVMGFADMLIQLGIPYNSEDALQLGERLMKFVESTSHKESIELGKERGSFPNFKGSLWNKKGYVSMRNASVTTIAPTGTISLISGCSSGIEPLFAIVFERHILDGKKLIEINPLFEKVAKERGFYSEKLMKKIARYGSVQKIKEVPKDLKKIFVTAHDISPDWHVKMQAGFQKYTDNAVSKTVNLSHNAPIKDVEKIYWLAYKLKCKGVTVYRYGSKPDQVLNLESAIKPKSKQKYVSAAPDYAGGCPTPFCPWS